MNHRRTVLLIILLATMLIGAKVYSYGVYSSMTADKICFDIATPSVGLTESATGVLKVTNCAASAARLYASDFTSTGSQAFAGAAYSLANAEYIGVAGGGVIQLRSQSGGGA